MHHLQIWNWVDTCLPLFINVKCCAFGSANASLFSYWHVKCTRDASLLLTLFTHEKFYSTRADYGDIVTSWFIMYQLNMVCDSADSLVCLRWFNYFANGKPIIWGINSDYCICYFGGGLQQTQGFEFTAVRHVPKWFVEGAHADLMV